MSADSVVARAAQLFNERLPLIEAPCECQFLWSQELPDLEPPFRSRLRSWLEIAPFEVVQYAIQRTCRKCWMAARQGRPLNSGQARSYAENVLKNELGIPREGAGWEVTREAREPQN
jgi:hypothetical protein